MDVHGLEPLPSMHIRYTPGSAHLYAGNPAAAQTPQTKARGEERARAG